MYYAEENLYDTKARQMAENRIMDSVEEFNQVRACFDFSVVVNSSVIWISTLELLSIIWRLGRGRIQQDYRKK